MGAPHNNVALPLVGAVLFDSLHGSTVACFDLEYQALLSKYNPSQLWDDFLLPLSAFNLSLQHHSRRDIPIVADGWKMR
ncbi:hypothetical protein AFLA_005255 [Aspergillus flavus NRRL3357]|nr:hypothetical protein AFLA_005255 [Aspergillus flavus NRRL3357]